MSNVVNIKTSFTSGEISKTLYGRGDLKSYINGAKELTNIEIKPSGGVKRREGLRFLDTLQGKSRCVSFEFNTEQTYLLVFSNLRMDIYKDGVNIANITTPWQETHLENICWTQSADTLLVTHQDVKPKKITRTSDTEWTIEDWDFYEKDGNIFQPYYQFHSSNITLTPTALSGTISLNANSDIFNDDYLDIRIRINEGEVKVTAINSATSVTATVTKALTSTTVSKDWKEQAFSDLRGYPKSCTYHQDRLVIGGSKSLPNRLWLSKSSDLMNFDLGTGLDDEAIEFAILSDQVNSIKAVMSARHLLVFTTGSEWMVTGEPLTPANIQLKRQTRVGIIKDKYIPPQVIDGATLFISANKKSVCEFIFADVEQAYQSNDLSLLAEHIINNPIDADYNPSKKILHLIMEDGEVANLTSYRSEAVNGWSKMKTSGEFISVAVVGNDTYFVIKRDDNYFLEIFDNEIYTDSALKGKSIEAKQIWSGLNHLIGKTVKIKGDGALLSDKIVDENGEVTLDYAVKDVEIGLAYQHIITPLPTMINSAGSITAPKATRLISARFRVVETVNLEVNTGHGLKYQSLKKIGLENVLDTAPPEFSGDIEIRSIGWIRDMEKDLWQVSSDKPFSCHILMVSMEMKVSK